ncbi:MAG: uncharacterized protein JWM80_6473 [Cyanobacteria bacterium RYN_339]|nr:uncharacterized protein [Cyanobacteria bacterium RYN_339]
MLPVRTSIVLLALVAMGAGPALAAWPPDTFEMIQAEAKAGDPRRQLELGLELWERGDRANALAWIRRAAEHGSADAQAELAAHYASGMGLPRNPALALKWYELAALGGERTALAKLATLVEAGAAGPGAKPIAATLWRQAADHGDPDASLRVARGLLHAGAAAKDLATAMNYLKQAAEANVVPARILLAQHLGKPGAGKAELAEAYFQYGCAEVGGAQVGAALGAIAKRLALPDLAVAQLRISSWIVDRDCEAVRKATYSADGKPSYASPALKWFLLAAANGDVATKVAVAEELARGTTMPRLPDEADKLFRLAIAGGDPVANRKYGEHLLRTGDPKHAAPVLETAASHGDEQAMATLYLAYKQGDGGVPRNVLGCVKWLKALANRKGERRMSYAADLADCYERGWGLPKDEELARRWLLIAVEAGNPVAELRWANDLERQQDLVGAATWYDIAGRNHHPCAKPALDRLAKLLSPALLTKARLDAAAWWSAHPEAHSSWGIGTNCG